jgi:recombination protein RecA
VKVVKNKVAPPFKQATFDILYDLGISRESEIIELGVAQGFMEKTGAWYSYRGERLGQGKDNVRTYLKDHPEICKDLEAKIRESALPQTVSVEADSEMETEA